MDRTLATKWRPRKLADVIGQTDEVDVLRRITAGQWTPPAILYAGPFGCGKTSMARLTARVLLCKDKKEEEPCGTCWSCKAMDLDNHPNYIEQDAASHGLVADVRAFKDILEYSVGEGFRIITWDEAHGLTRAAQEAMLQMLEEGCPGTVFQLCTTDPGKMLNTVRSRCVELSLKLLTTVQIAGRLQEILKAEAMEFEEKAVKIIATYVRGHLRDALMLAEQIAKVGGKLTEELVRAYLRLDRQKDVYELLTTQEPKTALEKLEDLLCNYAPQELQETIGKVLFDAYKLKLGVGEFTQLDEAWLKKVQEAQGHLLLQRAQRVLGMEANFSTITGAAASFAGIFLEESGRPVPNGESNGSLTMNFRKPKREETTVTN